MLKRTVPESKRQRRAPARGRPTAVLSCLFRASAPGRRRRISLAHSASAIKRVRQNAEHRERNRSNRSRLRSQIKKLRQALEGKDLEEARKLLPSTISLVDVMVKKGIIHENTGNRYKSRLSRRLASSSAVGA
jgi:small subunit ribosomal protein S20